MLSCKNCIHVVLNEDLGKYHCQVLKRYIGNPEKVAIICPDFDRRKSANKRRCANAINSKDQNQER